MSFPASRRNGSQASCEPCRGAKTRCDHQVPVCGRCRRRGPQVRCWYHPAPSRKPRQGVTANNNQRLESTPLTPGDLGLSVSDQCRRFSSWPSIVPITGIESSQARTQAPLDQKIHNEQLLVITEVLKQLNSLPSIQKLIQGYLAGSQVPLVPGPLILQILSSFLNTYNSVSEETESDSQDEVIPQIVEDILRNSSTEVIVNPSMSGAEFCELYCGRNLRVETLGLIYTIAARSLLFDTTPVDQEHDSLVQDLLRCSNLSMRLSRDISPQPNDVMVWLALENMQLVTLMEGDASLGAWRRLGELSTDIFAMGLHREATHSHEMTPFFLAQCRRRTFSSAYQLDKASATFFNRPPRIPKCYSDCKLPVDLTDSQILADTPDAVLQAQNVLDDQGWNNNKVYSSATWARMRFILGELREELLEYSFSVRIFPDKIRDLLRRCHEKWESVPARMRYAPDCWKSDVSVGVCFMLGKIYLSFLHIKMQLYRMIVKTDPDAFASLLHISTDMLQTVLQLGNARDRAIFLPRDLPTLVLAYGLPCANILATALRDSARQPPSYLPPDINRGTLIRELSVFVSHLDSVCGPQDANQVFCAQASKAISRALDDVLESFITPSNDRVQSPTMQRPAQEFRVTPSLSVPFSSDIEGRAELETFDIEGLQDFDLADWTTNINWNTVGPEWNVF